MRAPETQLFHDAFMASPIGIAVENLDGQPLFANPALCSMLGFSEEELRDKHCVQFSPPEDAEKDWALFEQLRAGSRDHYQIEKRFFRRDGSLLWGRLSISLLNSRPSPLVVALVEDITDKRRAEEAVRESEQRFRLLADTAPVLIWMSGPDKLCNYFNKPWLDFTGRTIEQEIGNGWAESVHPEDLQKCVQTYSQSFDRREPFRMEYRLRRRDGEYRWLLDIGVPRSNEDGSFAGYIGTAVDVTEQKRAEEAVRESERRFRLLADTAPVLIWMSGTDKRWSYFNKPWLDFTGCSIEEELGNCLTERIHPEDLQRCVQIYSQSFDRREPFRKECRLRRHDGEYRWLLDIGVPRFNEDGSFAGYIGTAVDVTEQKKAEEALRAGEERMRLAQQSAHIGSFEWNIQTEVNIWTPELESLYGLPPGGFGGTQAAFENLVHPDDRAGVLKMIESSLKTGQPSRGEWRVVWPDESVHWIAGRWQVFMNDSGEPSRMAGINIDVTERKLAEEKLREYERAVEGAEEMIVVVDREYRYLIANRQYLKMRNLPRERVIGHFAHEVLAPEVFPLVKKKLDECFQGKVVRYERKYAHPRLGERDLLVSYFPIEGASGIDRVACILRDVTERKQAEEALLGVNRRLIEAQEQERIRIGRELHDDINQRLALLAFELEQLRENPSEVQSRVRELLQHTIEISNDVQALSHELHSSKLQYLGVAKGIRSWCREFSKRQKIDVGFSGDVSESLPPEIGLCFFRVVQEAVHNAVKHGGGKQIEVQLMEQRNEAQLIVSDRGCGFDVETARQGRGLGLTSMQERVRLVNGTIAIESRPMHGTTIRVRVPFERECGPQKPRGRNRNSGVSGST